MLKKNAQINILFLHSGAHTRFHVLFYLLRQTPRQGTSESMGTDTSELLVHKDRLPRRVILTPKARMPARLHSRDWSKGSRLGVGRWAAQRRG